MKVGCDCFTLLELAFVVSLKNDKFLPNLPNTVASVVAQKVAAVTLQRIKRILTKAYGLLALKQGPEYDIHHFKIIERLQNHFNTLTQITTLPKGLSLPQLALQLQRSIEYSREYDDIIFEFVKIYDDLGRREVTVSDVT